MKENEKVVIISKTTIILVVIVIVVFVIPCVLNFVLPIRTGLNVIADEPGNGPALWLTFWGAYLSAIGSFVMAYISYKMNKAAVNQNNLILDNASWDKMRERYNRLETFVVDMECLHSTERLMSICCDSDYKTKFHRMQSELNVAALKIIRFVEEKQANEYRNQRQKDVYEYGMTLKKINVDIVSKLGEIEKDGIDNKLSEKISEYVKTREMQNKIIKMKEWGSKILMNEKDRIVEYARERNIEFGEFI